MKFVHLNLVVADPATSANFYETFLIKGAKQVWLGESLHLRNGEVDIAFQEGIAQSIPGAHHGFLADSAEHVGDLLSLLQSAGAKITDDCSETGFRSIKFLDPDGYEIEVCWEQDWP